jgi:hypothetical protein
MANRQQSGYQFEDEVRNIARHLFSNSLGQGSETLDGRERDGVFWNGEIYTVVEATISRAKDKVESDAKKTHELVTNFRKQNYMSRGFVVTKHEPTPDQKGVLNKLPYSRTTKIISFDEFRCKLFDSSHYISNRKNKSFGSVYDHVDNSHEVPLDDFVEPTFTFSLPQETKKFFDLSRLICDGNRMILIAEYGVGKSMVLRQLFHDIVKRVQAKKHLRTPIAINLRDHQGQDDPVELLERHARANATDPRSLVAAWNAGYVDLLIDGFDELSTRGWTGDVRRLKEYRRKSHSVVKKLIRDTPKGCGIIISGRDAYFDSFNEMREALGAPKNQFTICRVHPFDEAQSMEFLKKKGFTGTLPDWIPSRPLLLTYLAKKGLLGSVTHADDTGPYPRGAAWLSLLEMIALRESEQSEGVDKEALIEFVGALGIRARHTPDGQATFSPQQMEAIFQEVTGTTIMEDETNILLRLPGLGAAPDNPLNRSFIDQDFMNVCCTYPTLKFSQNPYFDYSNTYAFEALATPMSESGVEALATLFLQKRVQSGVITAAIRHGLSKDLTQLSFDLFRACLKSAGTQGDFTFDGVEVSEIDLLGQDYDNVKVQFSGCLINRVVLPPPQDTNLNIKFSDCLIGSLEGRVSERDLDMSQFVRCEISEFTDEYSVNSQVLDTSLPLSVRVLVVTLRKIFTQGGTSRLESALHRGLDQRSKMIVPDIINLLLRHKFIVNTGRQGKNTYAGTKAKRNEALKIIQTPNTANSELLRDVSKLSS